ncbi:MAG: hypothetical protein ACF8XB_09655 [Planctomycetota bacterium JB042]
MESRATGGPREAAAGTEEPGRKKERRRRGGLATGAAASLVALVVVLAYGAFLDADATRPGRDWADIHQVDALHVAEAQAAGAPTALWSFHLQGGTPLYSVPTKPLSYPPFLLAVRALGPFLGMNVLLVLHAILGGVTMVSLLRRLEVGGTGGLVGGLLFTGATYPGSLFVAQPFWGYALAWWPLSLAFAIDLLEGRHVRRSAVGLGAVLALQLHAGGALPLYWLGCFLVAFALPYLFTRGGASIGVVAREAAVAGGVFVGLAAVKLLPALAWLRTTGRAGGLTREEIFSNYADMAPYDQGHPAWTVLYVMTRVGGKVGIVSLGVGIVLGVLALARRGTAGRASRGAVAALAAMTVVALGVAHDVLVDWLPLYDRMRMPYRFFYPAGFAALLLAGIGVDRVVRAAGRGRPAVGRAVGGIAALLVLFDVARLPGVRFEEREVASAAERTAMAAPSFDAIDDGAATRFHLPRPNDQALWVARGLDSTTGLLGGDGSENARYAEWLPFRRRNAARLERTHGRVLDLLATRHVGAYGRFAGAFVRPLRRTIDPGVDALVACVEDERLRSFPFGGDGVDDAYGIVVRGGEPSVAGAVASAFDTLGPGPVVGARRGARDVYVAAVTSSEKPEITTRVAPAPGDERAFDLAIGPDGRTWVVGRKESDGGGSDPFLLVDDRPWTASPPPFVSDGDPEEGARHLRRGSGLSVVVEPGRISVERTARAGNGAVRRCFVTLEPVGGASDPVVRGVGPVGPPLHRLVGPGGVDGGERRTWGRLAITGLWPGVDVALRSTVEGVEFELLPRDGADLAPVRLRVRGGTLRTREQGAVVETPLGPVELEALDPASPARLGARPPSGEAAAELFVEGDVRRSLRFLLRAPADAFGGALDDQWKAIVIDGGGAVHLAGSSASYAPRPPLAPGAVGAMPPLDFDVMVAKLDRDGRLLWTAVVGGAAGDFAQGIAVDARGRPVVIGSTRSDDATLPRRGGPAAAYRGVEDVLLFRLTADGRAIDFLGPLGGADGDYGQGVAIAADGTIVVCGDTKSDERSFPVRGGLDPTFNGAADAFVGRIASDGGSVLALGYVGGAGIDVAYALALDQEGDVWIAGVTASDERTFPCVDPWDGTFAGGRWDGFLCEVAADVGSVRRSGYVGGEGVDSLRDVAVDADGRVWAAGRTTSTGRRALDDGASRADPTYEAYRARFDASPQLDPFVRPTWYERRRARPRAALVRDPVVVVGAPEARERAVRALLARPEHDLRRTVLIERAADDPDAPGLDRRARAVLPAARVAARLRAGRPGPGPGAPIEPIEPERLRFGPASLSIDLRGLAAGGAQLLLSDVLTLHPGWRASVDGVEAPLRRADGLVTAVPLRPGARTVRFTFRPPLLRLGAAGTAITLLVLLAAGTRSVLRGGEAA